MKLTDRVVKAPAGKAVAALLKPAEHVLNKAADHVLNTPKPKDRHAPGYQKEYQREYQRKRRAAAKAAK